MVVIGLELDRPLCEHVSGLGRGFRPSFEERDAHGPTAQRAARPIPFDGWSCVQDHPVLEARDHLPSRSDVNQHRIALYQALEDLVIGGFDRLSEGVCCGLAHIVLSAPPELAGSPASVRPRGTAVRRDSACWTLRAAFSHWWPAG